MKVSYSAQSGSLTVVPEDCSDPLTHGPEDSTTSCFLIFDGVGLTEGGLKDWLRLCAKQVRQYTLALVQRPIITRQVWEK